MQFKEIKHLLKKTKNGIKFISKVFETKKAHAKQIVKNPVSTDALFKAIQEYLGKKLNGVNITYQTRFIQDLNLSEETMLDLTFEIQNKFLPDGFLEYLVDNQIEMVKVSDMIAMAEAFHLSKSFAQVREHRKEQKIR